MDYEKAYKDALSRAKDFMNDKVHYALRKGENIMCWIFPELRESEDERMRKEILEYIDKATGCKEWIAWLEKQGEQKSNKIEPKFKVGDWIVYKAEGWKEVLQIETIDEHYTFTNGSSSSFAEEQYMRLWTIQDAKDGDVLALDWKDEWEWQKIVIFKSLNEVGVEGYGITFKNNKLAFKEDIPYYSKTWTKNLHPATKEQRNLLFNKMKDAGYEWDADKKELRKIEQNPAWSEEDETIVPCYDTKDSYCNGNCVDCVYKITKCWQTNEEGSLFNEPDQKSIEIEHDETHTIKQNKKL